MFSNFESSAGLSGNTDSLSPSLVSAMSASGVRSRLNAELLDHQILAALSDGLSALANLMQQQPRCRAQLIPLRPEQMSSLATRDTWVLVPQSQGWCIVSEKGVTFAHDGQPRAKLQRGFRPLREVKHPTDPQASPQSELPALILEFDTGLAPLRRPIGIGRANTAIFRLFTLMKLERRELWSLLIYSILIGGLSLAVPAAVQVLVNSIAMAQLTQPLIVLSALLFGVLVLSGATKLLRSYSAEILARRVFVRIAEDFCERIPRIAPHTHNGIHLPERCQRFFEVITIQKSLAVLVVDGLGRALQIAAGLTLLGFYHPLLLAFDLALVCGFVLVVLAGTGGLATANQESVAKYRVAAWVRELSEHAGSFRNGAGEHLAKERGDALIGDYLRFRKAHYRKLFLHLLSGVAVQVIAVVSLLGLGGYLVMKGELTLGQLVAAELVVGVVVNGFTQMGKYLEKLYDLLAGLEKIGMVIDLPLRAQSQNAPRPLSIELPAQSLQGASPDNLESVTLVPGHRYEVQSHDARTLITLRRGLLGHRLGPTHTPIAATARYAGHSSSHEVSPDQLASWSMQLSQESWHELTLLDQLRLGDPSINESRALEVLDDVGLGDWVRGLPSSVHSRCSLIEDQCTPRRRAALVLARAILAQPVLLLLGDWLDPVTISAHEQEHLLELLERELPGCILLSFARVSQKTPGVAASIVTKQGNQAA